MIENFHLLRPAWLLAILPLAFLLWRLLNVKRRSRSWQAVVDPGLLPHLLSGTNRGQSQVSLILIALTGLLTIIALAGPVWNKLQRPIFKQQSALVVVLDLSRSMDAGDIKPSRLIRARHKIADILTQRNEGQTALVVYAADAFSVVPFTDDGETINALLPGLTTDMMPVQGSRADQALIQAYQLFENTDLQRGDILLVSDGLSAIESDRVAALLTDHPAFRVSVLGIGTETGGPIPLSNGGFLKDSQGSIVIASLATDAMQSLAAQGRGVFTMISANDDDVTGLLAAIERNPFEQTVIASERSADVWQEQGPWLVLLLLPLVALAFRRGVLFVMPLLLSSLLLTAAPEASALEWDDLWSNSDQRALDQFEQGQHQEAAELFDSTDWKGASFYRSGDYQKALEHWQGIDSETGHYNRGNALAKLGELEQALDAYDQVLQKNPQHRDASHNRKLVEEALKQQQQQQSDKSDGEDGDESEEGEPSDESGQGQQSDDSNGEPSDQSSDQQSGQQDESKEGQSNSQDQQSEEEANQQADDATDESTEAEAAQAEQASLEQQLSEQAADQWLRKIPDDPGGLLRRKFLYQYKQRGESASETNPW